MSGIPPFNRNLSLEQEFGVPSLTLSCPLPLDPLSHLPPSPSSCEPLHGRVTAIPNETFSFPEPCFVGGISKEDNPLLSDDEDLLEGISGRLLDPQLMNPLGGSLADEPAMWEEDEGPVSSDPVSSIEEVFREPLPKRVARTVDGVTPQSIGKRILFEGSRIDSPRQKRKAPVFGSKSWTEEEDRILRENRALGARGIFDRGLLEGRTFSAIRGRYGQIGLSKPKGEIVWSEAEHDLLRANSHLSPAQIAKLGLFSGRSESSIRNQMHILGLIEAVDTSWTEEETHRLIENIKLPASQLFKLGLFPGRSETAINDKRKKVKKELREKSVHMTSPSSSSSKMTKSACSEEK